jgi:GT2 family glycosyltransferase
MRMIAFRRSDAPDVSVVVLVTREPALVRPSLEALAAALAGDVATEVVIVLNTTREDTRALVHDGVSGARVIVSPANCGTAVAWNVGFAAGQGAHVALVHEDTHPRAGWLEGLLDAAASEPRAFLVGSRILHTDGSIWNGGWVIWRDGWTTTLDDRSAPELMAAAAPYLADSVSSASMLVERAAFEQIGGFDEGTFPAITTNMDLAIAGWRIGRTVVATGRSTVVHATAAMVHEERGLYSSGLYREFLIRRSTRRLREKWADVLDAHYEPRGADDPTGDREAHLRALATTAARAAQPPPAPPPPSRQGRRLSAPDGGWATELDGARDRLAAAQREVDAEFDAWVVADREALHARILELDAGAAGATRAHDDALAVIARLEAENHALTEEKDAAARSHADRVARLEHDRATLAERAATLDRILTGRWWRLGQALRGRRR